MNERTCNLFEPCETPEAPLCPIQIETIRNGIWYPGEPVCKSKRFRNLPWIQKQQKIARMKLTSDDGFFTVKMLDAIHTVTGNIKGADPDEEDAESKWFARREEKKAATHKRNRTTANRKINGEEPVRKDMLL
jgi:hypothetical protein